MTSSSPSPHEIGRGASGVVTLVQTPAGYVAKKVCTKPESGDTGVYARELRAVRAYLHVPPAEGLIRISNLAVADDGNSFSYLMELADDEENGRAIDPATYRPRTLTSVLSAEIALPLRECIALGLRLSSAVAHLQRHHLLHRDIKPGNVLYIHGQPVLADIGLVMDVREATSLVGTPGYAPPENHGTPQGDVYSLGKTLYRASTGREPDEQGFAPCTEADTDAPYFWKWMIILAKACSPSPDKRHRSAKALRKDLLRLQLQTRLMPRKNLAQLLAIPLVGAAVWFGFVKYLNSHTIRVATDSTRYPDLNMSNEERFAYQAILRMTETQRAEWASIREMTPEEKQKLAVIEAYEKQKKENDRIKREKFLKEHENDWWMKYQREKAERQKKEQEDQRKRQEDQRKRREESNKRWEELRTRYNLKKP